MSDSVIKKIAIEQRRRLIATVLNAVDNEGEPKIRREKIIGAINVYHDFLLDVVKVSDEDVVRNEHALVLIAQAHQGVRNIEQMLGTTRTG